MSKNREKETVAETAQIPYAVKAIGPDLEAALVKIEQLYKLREPEEVREFLAENSQLIETLIEAYPRLEAKFGPKTEVALELFYDQEDNAPEPELFALVRTQLKADEAVDRLYSLFREWFLEQASSVRRSLSFDVEFV